MKIAYDESGLSGFGWNGHIMESAGHPLKVKDVGKLPLYDFLYYMAYMKARNKFQSSI